MGTEFPWLQSGGADPGMLEAAWSSSGPGVLAPLLSDTPQICPSLEHASLVLLNSLLDTVPGEQDKTGPCSLQPMQSREKDCRPPCRLCSHSTSSLAVRNYVDEHIGIDYSLLRDPVVSPETLDLDFKVWHQIPACLPQSFWHSSASTQAVGTASCAAAAETVTVLGPGHVLLPCEGGPGAGEPRGGAGDQGD